jgi:hypothetical protein
MPLRCDPINLRILALRSSSLYTLIVNRRLAVKSLAAFLEQKKSGPGKGPTKSQPMKKFAVFLIERS